MKPVFNYWKVIVCPVCKQPQISQRNLQAIWLRHVKSHGVTITDDLIEQADRLTAAWE